ncbi:hypothetical protein CHS0354_026138 [Potamilus streckersoni]|uniref:G-protein coupled receptors family 1 profile domain-containing protein n=1 Tax=Potamilus streckersoni TaxID=2493646 RepID=A0AAE0S1C2_9BIVA|nr:hypothetical protein CHS0354_026138 [Potamilus streckersoni]
MDPTNMFDWSEFNKFKVMCKVYYFVWNQSYTASLIILTVIAFERFLAIKYPLKARQWMTPRKLKSCTRSQRSAMYDETELANYATEITLSDNRRTYTGHKTSISNRENKKSNDKCISFCDDFASSGSASFNSDRYSEPSISGKSIRMIYINQGSIHATAVTEDANDSGEYQQTLSLNHVSQPRHGVRCTHSGLSSSKKIRTAKRKVIRLLIALVVSFAICVLPHHIRLLMMYWQLHVIPFSVEVYLAPASFIILYLNSGLNPILYALFSRNFRRSFKDSFYCCIERRSTFYNMDTVKRGSKYQERIKETK